MNNEKSYSEVDNQKIEAAKSAEFELQKFKTLLWDEGIAGAQNIFRQDPKKAKLHIAHFLIDKHCIKTTGEKKLEIHLYKSGIYVPGENILRGEIQELLEELATTHAKNEVLEIIKDLTFIERDEFKVDENFINLNNGVLSIEANKLINHDPKHYFFNKIPVDYDPKSECLYIKKFLNEILNESDVAIIQEWIGYMLYRRYFIKKAIIFVGEPNTGKTTLLNLLTKFIGIKNISGLSLQKLSQDKFSAAQLYTKHVNIYDDLSFKDINDTGSFKIATGGGIITGEYKFGNQFQFKNYSKLTFSCNKIPDVSDTKDDAYFSRWIVIQFNNAIPQDKMDKFLIDKLTSKEELSGLLNFGLQGLGRLLENQDFSYAKNPDETKEAMLKSGSALANFVYDCLEQAKDSWVSKDEIHGAFANYAIKKKLSSETKDNLGKKLPKYADFIQDSKGINPLTKKNERGWRNVKIKTEIVDSEIDEEQPNTEEQAKIEF